MPDAVAIVALLVRNQHPADLLHRIDHTISADLDGPAITGTSVRAGLISVVACLTRLDEVVAAIRHQARDADARSCDSIDRASVAFRVPIAGHDLLVGHAHLRIL